VQVGIPGFDDDQKRAIAASFGDLRVINLYVVNGKAVGDEKYDYKLRWLQAVHEWIAVERARYPNLIVLGDFNIAPDDRDVHDPLAWKDQILCSVPERAALTGLLDQGLHDSFRLFSAEGGQFSWWDYRQAGFRRNIGLRIDLVLVSEALKSRCRAAVIDREPRTWERPSDLGAAFRPRAGVGRAGLNGCTLSPLSIPRGFCMSTIPEAAALLLSCCPRRRVGEMSIRRRRPNGCRRWTR